MRRSAHLFQHPDPAQRRARDPQAQLLLVLPQGAGEVGLDQAGAMQLTRTFFGPPFDREAARQREVRGFRDAVGAEHRACPQSPDGRNDAAPLGHARNYGDTITVTVHLILNYGDSALNSVANLAEAFARGHPTACGREVCPDQSTTSASCRAGTAGQTPASANARAEEARNSLKHAKNILDDRFHESCHIAGIHLWFQAPICLAEA